MDDFNVDRITAALGQRGITRTDEAGNAGGGGLGGGPMKMRVRMRGPDTGGTREGTPELYFSDPDGIVMQLQDPTVLRRRRRARQRVRSAGAIAEEGPDRAARLEPLHDLRLGRRALRTASIRISSGLRVQAHQGPTAPVLGVGGVPVPDVRRRRRARAGERTRARPAASTISA